MDHLVRRRRRQWPRRSDFTSRLPVYDAPGNQQQAGRQEQLRRTGCEVIAAEVPRSPGDAIERQAFRREEIDLALLFFCTWVAEEITLAFARELMDVPMLIWSLPYLADNIPMAADQRADHVGFNIRRLARMKGDRRRDPWSKGSSGR